MRYATLLSVAVLLLVAGCGDEISNYYDDPDLGIIAGSVSPVDPGTVVMVSGSEIQTTVDKNGFFWLDSLAPGIYSVTITPVNYEKRLISGITVVPREVVQLGEITLSGYPYPIYRTNPADAEELERSTSYLSIYVDEPLILEDLASGVTIDPELPLGGWQFISGREDFYRCHFEEHLNVGVEYTVTVNSSIRLESGTPLGRTFSFSFRYATLEAMMSLSYSPYPGEVEVYGFSPRLSFNDSVIMDSLRVAASFEPTIEGIWIPNGSSANDRPEENRYRSYVFVTSNEPLEFATLYTFTLSDQVNLVNGISLDEPYTRAFWTVPAGVMDVYPSNGATNVPPYSLLRIRFNTPMDQVTTEQAFSVVQYGGDPVSGYFEWYDGFRELNFWSDLGYVCSAAYEIVLTTDARTATGENLTRGLQSYFQVSSYGCK